MDLYLYDANIKPIWAEEVLRERGGSVSAEELRLLTYLVTGSQLEADTAYARRKLQESRRV